MDSNPFFTINPNRGTVKAPDSRLNRIINLVQSSKATPASLEFSDIAGLVKGASQGEGLGNRHFRSALNKRGEF